MDSIKKTDRGRYEFIGRAEIFSFQNEFLLEVVKYNVGAFSKNVGDFLKNVGDFWKNVGEFLRNVGHFWRSVAAFCSLLNGSMNRAVVCYKMRRGFL